MNRKDYSQILDAVAGDQIPPDLDLAPHIKARIQKGTGIRMHPRTKLISAIVLVAIALAVLISAAPGVAAAIQRWFGYVPGIGLVREGQVRALAEPVSMTREGITVSVDEVVLDPERTALVYSVEGIPGEALVTGQEERCAYEVSLRLPDGSSLRASPNGIQAWASGYQHRFNYPPLPDTVKDATLVIPCLFHTRPGAAPEDWEIPLRFIPAPPEMTSFPVIEIPSPVAPPATVAGTTGGGSTPTAPAGAEAASEPVSLTLTLDRAVLMDDGYLLYATLDWADTPFAAVDIANPGETLRLLDSGGQEIRYEFHYDEQTGVNIDQRRTVFAIQTAPVQVPGPLTLELDSVLVDLPAQASFVFDPGPQPEPGQQWQPDLEVAVGERRLRVRSVVAGESGYEVELTSGSGIQKAGLVDLDHPIQSGYCTEGNRQGTEFIFGCGFNYANGLPAGPVTITITGIGVEHIQKLQAQWTPPAVSPDAPANQPTACLTSEVWQAALSQKPALPEGLGGKVVLRSLIDHNGSAVWGLTVANLDGSNRQAFPGAEDGTLSPDGAKLAYSTFGAGITIADLATGATTPVGGTGNGDFNPIWSPDGRQIVFNRGMGVFDLFITNPDGSDQRRLTSSAGQEWPVGWLPDGQSLLYSLPGRNDEYNIYQVDVQTNASQPFPSANLLAISPDGQQIATGERAIGDRWQISVSAPDGSNRRLLSDPGLWVLTPLWSQDGEWLLAGISDGNVEDTLGALIHLPTCQVIPLPGLEGTFYSWVE